MLRAFLVNQMVEEKVTKAASKVKRKKWIKIIAPKLFNNEIMGEIPVTEPKSLVGRCISVSLMGLIGDMKKQGTNVKFTITNVQGDRASTELVGYSIVPSSVRRLVRRGKERLEMSFICKTSDNKIIRIKPLMVPPIKLKGSVCVALRKTTSNYLTTNIAKLSFDNLIKDLITTKLQKSLKDELKKTYPLRIIEVAYVHIETKEKSLKKAEEIVLTESKEEVIEPKEEETSEKSEEAETKKEKTEDKGTEESEDLPEEESEEPSEEAEEVNEK